MPISIIQTLVLSQITHTSVVLFRMARPKDREFLLLDRMASPKHRELAVQDILYRTFLPELWSFMWIFVPPPYLRGRCRDTKDRDLKGGRETRDL